MHITTEGSEVSLLGSLLAGTGHVTNRLTFGETWMLRFGYIYEARWEHPSFVDRGPPIHISSRYAFTSDVRALHYYGQSPASSLDAADVATDCRTRTGRIHELHRHVGDVWLTNVHSQYAAESIVLSVSCLSQ